MKKIFVVLSALLMCCMFMGCGVKAQLVGTWKSSITDEYYSECEFEVTVGDAEPKETYLPALRTEKIDNTLTMNKNGTFSWDTISVITYIVDMDAAEEYGEFPEGTTFTSLYDSKKTIKISGTWYYHDSDKIILKTTKASEQNDDEEPYVDTNVSYTSAEVVLVDNILFIDYGYNSVIEFTKAE